jgi:hypothetical protein
LTALALANIAHHYLGMPPSIIRSDSLIAATFFGGRPSGHYFIATK